METDAVPASLSWREFHVDADVAEQDRILASLRRVSLPSAAFFLRDRYPTGPVLRLFTPAPARAGQAPRGIAALRRALRAVPHREVAGGQPWTGVDLPFRGPEADALLAGFLAGAREVLLAAAGEVHAGRRGRNHVAFDLMLAHLVAVASYLPGDGSPLGAVVRRYRPVPLSFPSVRAHRDGLVHMSGRGAVLEQRLRGRYAAHAAELEAHAAALLDRLTGARPGARPDAGGTAERWCTLVRAHQARTRAALAAGRLQLAEDDMPAALAMADPSIGAMHSLTARSAALRAYLSDDPDYLSMRVLMAALYLVLHFGLGVGMADRLVLCDTVSRACESLARGDAGEVMAAFVAALPAAA